MAWPYMLVVKSSSEFKNTCEEYSILYPEVPVVEVPCDYPLEVDLTLVRPITKFDKNYKKGMHHLLEISYEQNKCNMQDLTNFIDNKAATKVEHISDLDQVAGHLRNLRFYSKVLYVLTSNMCVQSGRYQRLLAELLQLPDDYCVAMVSEDLLGSLLNLSRDRQLRRYREPEFRLIYLHEYVN